MFEHRRFVPVVLVILGAVAWTGFGAGQAAAEWGAIAVANRLTTLPGWGYSFRYRSQREAERRAMDECNKKASDSTCQIKISFGSGCGTVGYLEATTSLEDDKVGKVLQLNIGAGPTSQYAVEAFHKGCNLTANKFPELGKVECNVLATVCASRGLVKP